MTNFPIKPELKVGHLRKIDKILSQWGFLEYCTQKRNMATWILFRDFLRNIFDIYFIGGGIEKMLIYNYIRITSDIIESALFCGLQQSLTLKKSHRKGTMNLLGLARKNQLIGRKSNKYCRAIINMRNDIHAHKQISLHIKSLKPSSLDDADRALCGIYSDLRNHFAALHRKKRNQPKRNPYLSDNDICLYCQYHAGSGEMCPACGNIII